MPLVKQRPASNAAKCYKCQAPVTFARIRDGRRWRPITIESCDAGVGNLAILPTLFVETNAAPMVEEVVNGTSWRRHDPHCPGPRSFSGTARARKVAWRDSR